MYRGVNTYQKVISILLIIALSVPAEAFAAIPTSLPQPDEQKESVQNDVKSLEDKEQRAATLVQKKNILEEFWKKTAKKPDNKKNKVGIQSHNSPLLTALQGNEDLLNAFNNLFGTSVPRTGSPNDVDHGIISDVEGDPNFNLTTFTEALPKTSSLYNALKNNPALLSHYNNLFGTTIVSTGNLSADDRKSLFDVTGTADDPATPVNEAYNETSFLSVLPKASSLYNVLKANSVTLADFNRLFGTSIQSGGNLTAADRKALFDITGDSAYVEADFLGFVQRVVDFEAAVNASSKKDAVIALLNEAFGVNLNDAWTRQEVAAMGNPNFGILFKEDGTARSAQEAIAFFERVVDYRDALDASLKKTQIDAIFQGA
ncbi:MAG: hypothetical protein HY592_04715, partial [Candidatus Omnitrophica bacterium]|nr:hypothetical protein [Candidatus Omnitrophota bacterium]